MRTLALLDESREEYERRRVLIATIAAAATVAADIKPARPAVSTTLSCFVEWSFVGLFVLGVGTSAWPSAASTSSSLAMVVSISCA